MHSSLLVALTLLAWAPFGEAPGAVINILTEPSDIRATKGDAVLFNVEVAADATPVVYEWRRNGQALTASQRISGVNAAALRINGILPDDEGYYELVATAGLQSVISREAFLSVRVPALGERTKFTPIYVFDERFLRELGPSIGSPLIEGSDGYLYGTTRVGGVHLFEYAGLTRGTGSLYKVRKDGSDFSIIHSFGGPDEGNTFGAIDSEPIEGSDGRLYGATPSAGPTYGFIYSLNKDGSDFRMMHSFGDRPGDGMRSHAPLVEGPDGMLYGVTRYGGAHSEGTVFRIAKDGSGYQTLHSFELDPFQNSKPIRPVGIVIDDNGVMHGSTELEARGGAIFVMNPDGTGFGVVDTFEGLSTTDPTSIPLLHSDGNIYGTTTRPNISAVYRLDRTTGQIGVLYQEYFRNTGLKAGLIEGKDGNLYTAIVSSPEAPHGAVVGLTADGSEAAVLHKFNLFTQSGAYPLTRPLEGSDGALYGVTGTVDKTDQNEGNGMIYRLAYADEAPLILKHPADVSVNAGEKAVFDAAAVGMPAPSLRWQVSTDAGLSWTDLSDGDNYSGTATARLSIRTSGSEMRNFRFRLQAQNAAGVVQTTAAILTTTILPTALRIVSEPSDIRVFKGDDATFRAEFAVNQGGISYEWRKNGQALAADPRITGMNGANLRIMRATVEDEGYYELVATAGAESITSRQAYLSVRVPALGERTKFTPIYVFDERFLRELGPSIGSPLIEGSDGYLYGTTRVGGANMFEYVGITRGTGSLYKVRKDGSDFSIIHSFGGPEEGNTFAAIDSEPIEGSDGRLYGATPSAGPTYGFIYSLNKDGSDFRMMHSFGDRPGDGLRSHAPLVEGPDGMLYGVTRYGGAHSEGTVFRIAKDGSGYQTLRSFELDPFQNSKPIHPVGIVIDNNGVMYGSTELEARGGAIFVMNPDGTGFRVVDTFEGLTTTDPTSIPMLHSDGNIYGTTTRPHISAVYRLNRTTGQIGVLYQEYFRNTGLKAGLIEGKDGNLYTAIVSSPEAPHGAVVGLTADGSEAAVLHKFNLFTQSGAFPLTRPLEGSDGALYGVTGTVDKTDQNEGNGMIYRLAYADEAPLILKHPADVSVNAGEKAIFDAAAVGMPAPSLRWQVSTDAGLSWTDLSDGGNFSGATTARLQVNAVTALMSGYRFRLAVANLVGAHFSNAAALAINERPPLRMDTPIIIENGWRFQFSGGSGGHVGLERAADPAGPWERIDSGIGIGTLHDRSPMTGVAFYRLVTE